MAIQVSSTTVIDNSRNLNNIAGADATTVSSLEAAGLGGSSTDYGAVGTYVAAYVELSSGAVLNDNATVAGSGLRQSTVQGGFFTSASTTSIANVSAGLSGTWRHMSSLKNTAGSTRWNNSLWVRIS